jgi:hypothetical protein
MSLLRLGFSGVNLMLSGPNREEQIERLGRDVIPTLRAEFETAAALQEAIPSRR